MKREWRRFSNNPLWGLLSLVFTGTIAVGLLYVYLELHLPNVDKLRDVQLQVPLKIYTADHKLMAEFGAKRRIPVKIDQVPPLLIKALLDTEDARYYQHAGVDFIGLVRAAVAVLRSGHKVEGASTITMQVARNFFLSPKKTYIRKINEILLALKIDRNFSKNDILQLYLNKVFLGHRAYGVAAAAQVYYGKKLSELTLPEMAVLAGLPQAPSRDNPLTNPKAAFIRRNHVLERMHQLGDIDKATYESAIRAPITASYHGERIEVYAPYVAEMVRQKMIKMYGDAVDSQGFKVITTISSKLEKAARHAIKSGLWAYNKRHGYHPTGIHYGDPSPAEKPAWQQALENYPVIKHRHAAIVWQEQGQQLQALLATGQIITIDWPQLKWARVQKQDGAWGATPTQASDIAQPGDLIWVLKNKNTWALSQIPQAQGALVSLDPTDGAILALTGGFDFRMSHFNRAVQAKRQPGSSFKPFIYSAALNKGYTLASEFNDAPIVLKDTGENQYWRPHNDNYRFHGPTRLRVGLTESLNLVSVRILHAIGIPYAIDYVTKFGFDKNDLPHALSLALGSLSVAPITMARAYAVFANGGHLIQPYFISTVINNHNQVVYQAAPLMACQDSNQDNNCKNPAPRVITPQNNFLMTQALRGVIKHGTGRAALVLKRDDLAGKTGTTNDLADAWFSGFNGKIETTVWVGHDDLRSLHEYGAQAALPIWIDYMREALKGVPETTMKEPVGIVNVRIDPNTGLLAAPGQKDAIFEYFRQKEVPTEYAQADTTPHNQDFSNSGGDSMSAQIF